MVDMADKVRAKIIEINKTELKPGAKYVFFLDPLEHGYLTPLFDELDRLIGRDNFTLLPISKNNISVYEITNKQD